MSPVFKLSALTTILACVLIVHTHAASADAVMYVNASRLALRAAPQANAKLDRYLVTNTAVQIKARSNDWCEINVAGQAKDAGGFVACQFLADEKLRLSDIHRQLAGDKVRGQARLDLLQQQFWVSPSASNLLAYGQGLDLVYPFKGRNEDELPKRPARPEFEAMKQFLLAGWNPAKYEYATQVEEQESTGTKKIEIAKGLNFLLPPIKPSLYTQAMPDLIATPYVGKRFDQNGPQLTTVYLADAYGLLNTILNNRQVTDMRLASTVGPLAGHYGGYQANWDIGGVRMQFSDVKLIGISADGSSFQNALISASTEHVQYDAECDQLGGMLKLRHPVARQTAAKDVLALLLLPASTGATDATNVKPTSVRMLTSVSKPVSDDKFNAMHRAITGAAIDVASAPTSGNAFMKVFDLNGDGIADLAFEGLEGKADSNELASGPSVDRVFNILINLNGNWVKHSFFIPLRCAS